MADEEPSIRSSAPPPSAFGDRAPSGGPPPPSAFSSNTASSSATPGTSDLNARWKQYEAEKEGRSSNDNKKTTMVGPDGPAHGNYDLYETPEKQRRPSSHQSFAGSRVSDPNPSESEVPRRAYSFTKSGSSSSYNTDALIAKYAGISGVPTGAVGMQRTLSNTSIGSNKHRGSVGESAISPTARAEAEKVLAIADERISANQAYQVKRTESGGFSASAAPDSGPPYFTRSSGNTRRTPSALAGLGFNKSASKEHVDWKAQRYAFSDPKFREDDYLAEEEDEIVGPSVTDPLDDENETRQRNYRDDPRSGNVFDNVDFDGDFPHNNSSSRPGAPSWSTRYSDNPTNILNQYDRAHSKTQKQPGRQSARKMFMSTASTMSSSMRAFGGNVSKNFNEAKNDSKVFGKGFSFKNKNLPGSPARNGGADATGSTNLRTVWKDDTFRDEDDGEHKQHKTWEQVEAQKIRRRKIGLSVLLIAVAATIIGVALSQTSWRWKYKNLWRNGNVQMDVTFYATSNSPLGFGKAEDQLVQDLKNIPSDAEFVVHLGNLQDATLGMCPAARMSEVASLLHGQSPVPIFVVPGEHDWIRCPNQLMAFARWLDAFGTAEALEKENSLVPGGATTASSAGEFERSKSTPEIFHKLHHGVLLFGLHLVSGTVTEGQGMAIQNLRDDKMAIYVRGTLDRLQGEYRAVVMLGNARPGPQQQKFFELIREDLKQAKVPASYVHAHSGFGETEHYPFGTKKSGRGDVLGGMMAIQAASGGANQPPLKITVGFGKQPFTIG